MTLPRNGLTTCSLLLVALMLVPPTAQSQMLSETARVVREAARWVRDPGSPPMPEMPARQAKKAARFGLSAIMAPTPTPSTTLTGSKMVFLTVPAGLSLVSVPVRTSSQKMADLFPNLPDGAVVWTWNAESQEFREGLDQDLPIGQACWMYLPVPAIVPITGDVNLSSSIPVELQDGWNLVGVPYEGSLDVAEQQVYVDQVKTRLDDAIEAGVIGNISTLDGGQSKAVDVSDSMQPFHGYWVYSNGKHLLQLKPVALNGYFDDTFMGWGIKSVGSGILGGLAGYGVTYLLNSLAGDPVQEKLDRISAQLDQLAAQQTRIEQSISNVATMINKSVAEIQTTINETAYIAPVREKLAAHYDSGTPQQSLQWFRSKATVALAPTVSEEVKTQFARNILTTWDFPSLFINVKLAILGTSGSAGVIDSFANKIVLDNTPYTLTDRYTAFQNYFAELIGMQIKCAELIGEAYHQQGLDSDAKDWYNTDFLSAIQAEYRYFGQVVERLAMSKVAFSSTPTADAPVTVPGEVQAMLARADFMLLDALNEPEGLRLHIATSPDVVMPASVKLTANSDPNNTQTITPPAAQWKTVNTSTEYDSWKVSNHVRQFRVTNSWKMVKVIVPGYASGTSLVSTFSLPVEPARAEFVKTTIGTYDSTFNPAATGKVFGSMFVAARPDVNSMLNPCANTGEMTTSTGRPFASCNVVPDVQPGPQSWAAIPFTYVGTETKTGTFQAYLEKSGKPAWNLYLLDQGKAVGSAIGGSTDARMTLQNVVFTPNHVYTFQWGLGYMYLYGSLRYGGTRMAF